MIVDRGQVFNLMDTNGRRNDVITAMQGYLKILDNVRNDLRLPWDAMPDSLAEFLFYRQAIEMFPDVFRVHKPYDDLASEISSYPELQQAMDAIDLEWLKSHQRDYAHVFEKFDKGIEDRARHYTSNLVKLGFADSERNITPAGDLLLGRTVFHKDPIEKLLPLNKENIIYLRQLLKLRLFDREQIRFYSPFIMGVYALLRHKRLTEETFLELLQGTSPYSQIEDIDSFIDNYSETSLAAKYEIQIPSEIDIAGKLPTAVFSRYFTNRKSSTAVNVYQHFYTRLFSFVQHKTADELDALLTYYEAHKQMLNKAFGLGRRLFAMRAGARPTVQDFLAEHAEMFEKNINIYLYEKFTASKALDIVKEYSDTTKRIFKATGIISFTNGYVELAYHELCDYIFDVSLLRDKIIGNIEEELNPYYDNYEEYEEGVQSYFVSDLSLCEILGIEENITAVSNKISAAFGGAKIKEIPKIIADRRRDEFEKFIEETYDISRVKELLSMFSDRSNDKKIKEAVSPDATVPTIYEYVVGIAWYYFSEKRIDLLSSYNLTLSANFEPLNHAGGGQGDIVIYEDKDVTMLEATLMDSNSQKRGEWEPVLRHSVNLKVEEESNKTGRRVTTFFIADVFDANTVNIWKAVASVPLQSSVDRKRFTDNVVIMPLNSCELCALMDKSAEYEAIIDKVHNLFEVDKVNFDLQWRNKFVSRIL